MIELYHSQRTRSARILWLLEELGLEYDLKTVEFRIPDGPIFVQDTPAGKLPTLVDGDVTMIESGAMVEYLVEKYGDGRLGPPPGDAGRAAYLQWIHFAEATAFPGIGNIAWHGMVRQDADKIPDAIADYTAWATSGLATVNKALEGRDYLLGSEFSAADVMMGYTVQVAEWLGLLSASNGNLKRYLERLQGRAAFQTAFS